MDIAAGPAALGGLILCVAMCGWALGRWQAELSGGCRHEDASPKSEQEPFIAEFRQRRSDGSVPLQCSRQGAEALRHRPLSDFTLCELHREVTAIRHHERILATLSVDSSTGQRRLLERTQFSSGQRSHVACPLNDAHCQICDTDGLEKPHLPAQRLETMSMANLPQPASELSLGARV